VSYLTDAFPPPPFCGGVLLTSPLSCRFTQSSAQTSPPTAITQVPPRTGEVCPSHRHDKLEHRLHILHVRCLHHTSVSRAVKINSCSGHRRLAAGRTIPPPCMHCRTPAPSSALVGQACSLVGREAGLRPMLWGKPGRLGSPKSWAMHQVLAQGAFSLFHSFIHFQDHLNWFKNRKFISLCLALQKL
jgi:hypothetical protein